MTSETSARNPDIANIGKGLFDDGAGGFTKRGEPDQTMAIQLMFDEDYHRHKAAIFQPIDAFFTLLDNRTAATVKEHGQRSSRLLYSILGMLIVLALMTGASRLVIARRILRPIVDLQSQTEMVAADLGRLTDVAHEISSGNLAQSFWANAKPLRLSSRDEFGQLARAHDHMITCLQKTGMAFMAISSVCTSASDNCWASSSLANSASVKPMSFMSVSSLAWTSKNFFKSCTQPTIVIPLRRVLTPCFGKGGPFHQIASLQVSPGGVPDRRGIRHTFLADQRVSLGSEPSW